MLVNPTTHLVKRGQQDVVMGLMNDYQNQGYILYVDNYCLSPGLFKDQFGQRTLQQSVPFASTEKAVLKSN